MWSSVSTRPSEQESAPLLSVRDLVKCFPRNGNQGLLRVLDRVSFDVKQGEFISIVGPSGCGKTTLIEVIAGLQNATEGHVEVARQRRDGAHVGTGSALSLIVFQQYNRTLYPFMSVAKNIGFALDSCPGISKKEKRKRVDEALSITGLADFDAAYPWELSGGMQQRVAIARAIVARPRLLLLDEPFGSLDTQTKNTLEDELLSLVSKFGLTAIYVTHDIDSALYCGSRVMLLTARPARMARVLDSDLPYPRDQIETRKHPLFLEYREVLYKHVSGSFGSRGQNA